MGASVVLERLLWGTYLQFAAGFTSNRVAENIDRVVGAVGTALALSVGGIVFSLVVTAVVIKRQRS